MNAEEVDDIIKEEEVQVEEEESGEKIPDNPNYWFSRILKQHPEILSMKEKGRPLAQMPGDTTMAIPASYGKDYQNSAYTESSDSIPPTAVMQLILNYLHEEGFTQARDMLLIEAKELFPELLESMCYQPSDVPPMPPLGFPDEGGDSASAAGGSGGGGAGASEKGESGVPNPAEKDDEGHSAFNEKTLSQVYHQALVPLLQLGAGKADMSDLFALAETGGSTGGVPGVGGGVSGGDKGGESGDKTTEDDQEVEAVEEYTSEITFDDDEEEDKDENVWDDDRPERKGPVKTNGYFVAGTLNQIINWLTDPENLDRSFMLNFLQTYPLVITADKLMAKLIQRYNIPQGLRESEQEKCILALKIIKVWIERYPGDITGSVHDLLSYFLRVTSEKKNTTKQFGELYATFANLDDLKARRAAQYAITEEDVPLSKCEPSIVPRNIFSHKLSLDDVDERELTRQFYVIDYVMFWRIQPRELIGRNWALHPERAPNVNRMLARMHKLTRWTQLCILQGYWSDAGAASPDHLRMFGKFVSLAISLWKHLDFFSAWAIYLAINSKLVNPVLRLVETRKDIPPEVTSGFKQLTKLFSIDENYATYRKELKKHPQRSIPAIVVHLGDLSLVDESIPTIIHASDLDQEGEDPAYAIKGDLINYQKLGFTAKLIGNLFPHRDMIYQYQYVDQIAALIKDVDADEKVIQQLAEAGFK